MHSFEVGAQSGNKFGFSVDVHIRSQVTEGSLGSSLSYNVRKPKVEQSIMLALSFFWESGLRHTLFSFAHFEVSRAHKHIRPVSLNLSDILISKKHRGSLPFQARYGLL